MSDLAFAPTPGDSGILSLGSWPKHAGYLARQPILNRRGGVLGYELRYHDPAGPPSAANHALIDALALFGAERFAGGQWAFVRCTTPMLMDELFEALPPAMMVLEFPSSPEPSPRRLRAGSRLVTAGFRLALTEFAPGSERDPLIDYVDYLKIDPKFLGTPEWETFSRQLHFPATTVIAENIHTHAAFRGARAAGVEHFQGFYFCHPELIPNGSIPANRVHHLEILHHLFNDPLDLKKLRPLVERDPSLVYRLLRFVNSPICAVREPVSSIESAILLLGDAAFRRIATLAIQCGFNQNQSPELLNMALVRARFCAGASHLCGLDPDEQYLLGMLSLLPPMLGVPMELILPGLPLREPIRNALAGLRVKERSLLAWIEELEQDRIAECDTIAARSGLKKHELVQLYLGALHDAGNIASVANAPA